LARKLVQESRVHLTAFLPSLIHCSAYLTACPEGSIGLITGPSLPDIKRTSIEAIPNGVGAHRYGQ
jgi:hypothetical protein